MNKKLYAMQFNIRTKVLLNKVLPYIDSVLIKNKISAFNKTTLNGQNRIAIKNSCEYIKDNYSCFSFLTKTPDKEQVIRFSNIKFPSVLDINIFNTVKKAMINLDLKIQLILLKDIHALRNIALAYNNAKE